MAWINRLTIEAPSGLQTEYEAILDTLFLELLDSLGPIINKVREDLSLLFRPDLLIVLQYDDFLENNFYIEEATGYITSIIDWG